jgi:phytoene/squalene synthetase
LSHRQATYDRHLAGVSRSFAACIAELEQPLRRYVGLSYLLCRVLDTLEDAPWACSRAQHDSFLWLDRAVLTRPLPSATASFGAAVPRDIPPAEAALLHDAHDLLADLHALPARVRRTLQRTLLSMSAGMRRFLRAPAPTHRLRLADLPEVNRYCFVVAGVVGTLLTRLLDLCEPTFRTSPAVEHDAVHFGLLLQKINLLKDQATDEREGRFLLPDRDEVVASLRVHAEHAARYLLRVPARAQGFRRFCGWSLFLAAGSVGVIEATPGGKLPRAQTEALFAEVAAACRSNVSLRPALRAAIGALPASQGRAFQRAPAAETTGWLATLPGSRHPKTLARALA